MNTSASEPEDGAAQALRQLAQGYAQAVDRNDPELLISLMTEDAVIEGPGFQLSGKAEIGTIPGMLKQRYRLTRHLVHQQNAQIEAGRAYGETHAEASHVYDDPAAGTQVLVWHLRYQDEFANHGGRWLFARRRLLIDWTEIRPAILPSS
jgi:ketosteroid isomerase-like protein